MVDFILRLTGYVTDVKSCQDSIRLGILREFSNMHLLPCHLFGYGQ